MTNQENMGAVPPFTGMAVNVTTVPMQTGLAEAAIKRETGKFWETVMVTILEITVEGLAQFAEDVIDASISSPFAGV